ncbi:MAG: efflux RND transporter periplasmic adaptor subunit [Blautia hansenii]
MKKKQKIIAGVCAAVCIGGLAAGIFFSHNKKEKDGKELAYVMSVSSMNEMAGIQRMSGVVESQKTQDIQKDSEREVKEVLVKAGDEVDVGTALFTYDTEKLEADLQQAQLDLERADNDMANLKAQIAQLQKDKENASEDEQLSYTTQIQSGEMDLKKSEYERKAKEVEINRLQSQIQNSTVKSDMKGVVKSVNNENSSNSNMYSDSSQAFMTILATGQYRIKGKVNEQNVSQVVEGQPAIIRSRVDENMTWRGTYTAVDTKNPNNSSNNMMYGMSSEEASQNTSTSYPFYVELESSEGLLLGQHVYIEQDNGLEEREKGIWLDEAFIADIDKKPYVWAETGKGTLEKRTVVLGTYDENMMQYKIEKGLKSADYVAYPQEFLKEGMKTTHEIENSTMGGDTGGEVLPEGESVPEGEVLPEGEMVPEGETVPGVKNSRQKLQRKETM